MTYKLEPWIEKISSLVTLKLTDGGVKRYRDGAAVSNNSFDKHFVVEKISTADGRITLTMEEAGVPITGWIGEEQQSIF